ncbi:hypothetical protein [Chitinophaga cymbidii]|uniref:Uncharacterized protein n=1 Tax=Chitinophaga cymbidii TaxID=1096750 RepID=A0A512RPR9_9BACT|nr:hypothetical protein [Chitinophaga cymbidii]GEP97687.1 hypothetical protein CCY01nite_39470 [Chitinophaga cymbidii]
MQQSLTNENFITVIPHLAFPNLKHPVCLEIKKLRYWNEGQCEHSVTEETIELFLRNAQLYNVSIYPEQPELGCYAMDGEIQPEKGERQVHEIFYKGHLIYRHS